MHLRPGVHRPGGTMGAGYQRSPDIQMPGECDHHVLVVENMAGFAGLALIDVAARFAKP